jgi:hypothetical protein
MTIGMSSKALIARLNEMARELRDIRKNDIGGWVPEVRARLKAVERELLSAAMDIEDDD